MSWTKKVFNWNVFEPQDAPGARGCRRPECPAGRHRPAPPPPGCVCGKPIWIVIPPGGHIHPCPVHPEYAVYGSDPTL